MRESSKGDQQADFDSLLPAAKLTRRDFVATTLGAGLSRPSRSFAMAIRVR